MKKKNQKKKDSPKLSFDTQKLQEILDRITIYEKPKWAVQQITRESGLIEDVCKCGTGHPNLQWLEEYDSDGKLGFGIHGCCGCCSKEMKKAIKKKKI
jgi:hypothetical protein